jgi:hypothetical protein
MTPAQLAKKLAEVEAAVAKLAPPVQAPEWAHYTTDEELDWLEKTYRELADSGGTEPTQADQLRVWSIYAAATARMVEAEPTEMHP